MNTEIPQLKVEVLSNGCIRLENTDFGDSYAVDIHPTQLRYLAEKPGLVREVSATDADMVRMVVKLKRRLLKLRDRIDRLGEYLCLYSDSEHADLSWEQDYATATADICEEFCADLDEMPGHAESRDVTTMSRTHRDGSVTKPNANPEETQRVIEVAVTQSHALSRDDTPLSRGTDAGRDANACSVTDALATQLELAA